MSSTNVKNIHVYIVLPFLHIRILFTSGTTYPLLPHSLSINKVRQLTRFHARSESLLISVPMIQKLIN